MYQLLYHPHAQKQLKHIHPTDRLRMLEKLRMLGEDPNNTALNIKKLRNTDNSFRLRSGNVRAIFELDTTNKIIYVWDIDYRGSIY